MEQAPELTTLAIGEEGEDVDGGEGIAAGGCVFEPEDERPDLVDLDDLVDLPDYDLPDVDDHLRPGPAPVEDWCHEDGSGHDGMEMLEL